MPPYFQVVSGLRSHCNYSARVSCVNEVGASPFSPWLHFRTPESGDPATSYPKTTENKNYSIK